MKNRLFPFHQEPASESWSKNSRLIVIGDVHGCIRELDKLIKKINPQKKDRILFLGDLVNRGPESKAVVELARNLKARSLVGNHELRLMEYLHTQDASDLRPYELSTLDELEAEDWKYLESMILWLEFPKDKKVFVHGGFLPNQPWHKQLASVVTQIQNVDRNGRPSSRNGNPKDKFWANLWKQKPYVIYGHTPRANVYKRPKSLGIDTGCVWGGKLTALILPENRIIQIKSARNYIKDWR